MESSIERQVEMKSRQAHVQCDGKNRNWENRLIAIYTESN